MNHVDAGKDINEVLAMPYHFFIQLLKDKNKVKPSNSFFDLVR